jgi:hypothetical protein
MARKGSRTGLLSLRQPHARRERRVSERGRGTSEGVAKRRARSLKRETGGGAPATQTRSGWGVQGQRAARRGTRTRQRRT